MSCPCPRCGGERTVKAGTSRLKKQIRFCKDCDRSFYEEADRHIWSAEEDDLLLVLGHIPHLEKVYNRHAKVNGWRTRSLESLKQRLRKKLGEKPSEDWVTQSQLMVVLGLGYTNNKTPVAWKAAGLKIYEDGKLYRIHLGDFARWALTSTGAELVARAVESNRAGIEWLLWCIAEYRHVPNPVRSIAKKRGAA